MKFRYRVIFASVLSVVSAMGYIAWSLLYGGVSRSELGHRNVDPNGPRLPEPDILSQKHSHHTPKSLHQPISKVKQGENSLMEDDDTIIRESDVDIKTIDLLNAINEEVRLNPQVSDQPASPPKSSTTTQKSVEEMAKGLPLKVIVVPHSHSDPGWHKTVDGYFADQTKPTLDNMLKKLTEYPQMTFVWAESVFFSMWWTELEKEQRDAVRNLIRRGQLEIVGGSWVVPDEANTHYYSLVDQMMEGHCWLKDNVGVIPENTWSLDPFGYSEVIPYLNRIAGFNHSVILRVHRNVKEQLQRIKALEFIWKAGWKNARNESTKMHTLLMPYMLYNIKHSCGPDPRICLLFDFRMIRGEVSESRAEIVTPGNVDRLSKLLLGQYQRKANLFRHNVVLIPLGDDFRYDRAVEWDQQYKNYMQLFNHMNRKSGWNVQARFGTIADYFREVKAATDKLRKVGDARGDLPSVSGDFFPYTDNSDEYWTGYFSTRPYAKGLSRDLEVFLRTAEFLHTIAMARSEGLLYDHVKNRGKLTMVRQHLALFQHHDGITGTSRVWVNEDFLQRLKAGLLLARSVIGSAAGFLLRAKNSDGIPAIKTLEPLSARMLSPTHHVVHVQSNGAVKLQIINNVAHKRQELIHVAINHPRVSVTDYRGRPVLCQITPIQNQPRPVKNPIRPVMSDSAGSDGLVYMLSFIADLPPLGISSYNVITASTTSTVGLSETARITTYKTSKSLSSKDIIVNSNHLEAAFSLQTGLLKRMKVKSLNHTVNVDMNFLLYESRRSGAYIFSPTGPAALFDGKNRWTIELVEGPVFNEVRLTRSVVTHVARLIHCDCPLGHSIELSNVINMTKMDDSELIMRLDTSVQNENVFYTDQNGFQTARRKRFANLPREASFYPATSSLYIQDDRSRLSLILSNPYGVSSQKEGSIEVMLDRRLRYDDNRGLGEGILDNTPVYSRFLLLVECRAIADVPHNSRFSGKNHVPGENHDPGVMSLPSLFASVLTHRLRNQPVVLVSTGNQLGRFQPLSNAFSCDVRLVNLRSLSNRTKSAAMILHRTGHESRRNFAGDTSSLLECNPRFVDPVPVDIFESVSVSKLTETSLSMLHTKSELDLRQSLRLEPMELYTYQVDFN